MDDHNLNKIVALFCCKISKLPLKHIGLPVRANLKLLDNWKGVIDKFKLALSKWKRSHLSIGGKITLLKFNLSNLPIYFYYLYLECQ